MDDARKNQLLALKRDAKTQDEVIAVLFAQGYAVTEAMVAMRTMYRITLADAKHLVANSEQYATVHHANRQLHDALAEHADSVHKMRA